MTSHMQVNRADVETDADVFAFETKLVPNYGLPIYVKGEARVEIPAYAAQHVDAWVYNSDGKWQSDVKGLVAEFRIECAPGLLGSRHRSGIRLHDRQEGCAGRMGTGIGR